jgi:peptidoglycan/LPS O-acetylase OafA/YrhL
VLAHGYFGVDIFFMLSGLVLSLSYEGRSDRLSSAWYREFITRRIAKIYPLQIITFLLVALFLLATHFGRHSAGPAVSSTENTWWSALCNLFMMHSLGLTHKLSWNIYSWSVSAEWLAYSLLFPFVMFCLKRWRVATVWALSLAAMAAYLLLCQFVLRTSAELTTLGALRIVPDFLAGYALYRVIRKTHGSGDWWLAAGIAVMIACCLTPLSFWLILPATGLILTGCYRRGRLTDAVFGNKAAVLLGESSYSIYMFQYLVFLVANVFIRALHVHSFVGSVVASTLELVCAAGVGVASYRWMEEPLRLGILERLLKRRVRVETALGATEAQLTSTAG